MEKEAESYKVKISFKGNFFFKVLGIKEID